MDFPSTDCERYVLNHLKIERASLIPFGILQYIHAACRTGFPSLHIAVHCARLLAWPKVFAKLLEKYPNLSSLPNIERDLQGIHLVSGPSSRRFLERLSSYLQAIEGHDDDVKMLEQRLKDRAERTKVWEAVMEISKEVNNTRFEEELRFEYEVFDMSLENVQSQLMKMADAEANADSNAKPKL
ncbi:hypothetical protein HH212_22845 [Massilia forsythiae]|uniref:Uncharacterized protein n=1 Tax=Massilia forsythiae TaxID=2728020 RepID=A0A7Z2VZV6_9BURK|nr:hypothetical protein [Massilia forsythiae]QJE02506.1 hypothetical protein HH212_22845 [Massilia forsythiae]